MSKEVTESYELYKEFSEYNEMDELLRRREYDIGYAEGLEIGRQIAMNRKIAKFLKKENYDMEIIMKATDLSEEEIMEL